MSNKETRNKQRDFLLTFFDKREEYQEKEVNDFVLVKFKSGNTGIWGVMIYTKESFKNYKEAKTLF